MHIDALYTHIYTDRHTGMERNNYAHNRRTTHRYMYRQTYTYTNPRTHIQIGILAGSEDNLVVLLLKNLFSYYRICSLTTVCVLYNRMCSYWPGARTIWSFSPHTTNAAAIVAYSDGTRCVRLFCIHVHIDIQIFYSYSNTLTVLDVSGSSVFM